MRGALLIRGYRYTTVGITWATRCEKDRIKVYSLGPSLGANCGQKEPFRIRRGPILHHNGFPGEHLSFPKITRYWYTKPGGETLSAFISPTEFSCRSDWATQ
jgi:hypothetical protein